jgi:hypothetical protein
MNCSTSDAFDQFRKWREDDRVVSVSFVDASTSAVPRAGFSVRGKIVDVEESDAALGIRWTDGEALLNLRDVEFSYAEPGEASDPGVRARVTAKFEAAVQADWSDGSRCLVVARRD